MTRAPRLLLALTLCLAACPRRVPGGDAPPPRAGAATEPATTPEAAPIEVAPSDAPVADTAVPDGSSREIVGVAVPLSGKYKAWGEAILEGVEVALAGSGQRVVAKDTRGEPDGAAQALAALAAEGAIAALGGVANAEAQQAAQAAQELRLPFLSLSRVEKVTDAGPFVFRNMLTAEAQAKALVDFAVRRRGMKRFAMLWPTNPYGQELAGAFWDDAEAKGAEIRGAEPYEPDRTTFSPLVRSLVGKAHLDERADYQQQAKEIAEAQKDPFRRNKALQKLRETLPPIADFDAIFIPDFARNLALLAPALAVEDVVTATCDPDEVERVKRTTGRDDVAAVQLLGANGWDDPTLLEKAGRYVQCAVFVDGFFARSERPETRRFAQAFEARHQRPPSILEASAHDAAALVRHVVQAGAVNRDGVRAGLGALRGFPGATGAIRFDDRREVSKPLFFLTVDGESIRELRPEELAPPGAG